MIQSMTGFAEKRFDSETLSAKFSIRTLNHRFLDWNYRGAQIGEVENRLRAICQRKIHRGRVEVFLELSFLDPTSWDLRINKDLLLKIFSSFEEVFSQMNKQVNVSAENMFAIPHLVELRRKNLNEKERKLLTLSFEDTLEEVLKMRRREGREIKKELRGRLQYIRKAVNRIERLVKKQPALIQEKLKQRLEDLNFEASLSDEKLVEEAAYYAQRYDLNEEIMRLKCHLDYFVELLSLKNEEPVGKKLDFVAQELFREANTVNSKSQNIEISRESLAVKGEVESIRQQVQNIE